MSKAVLFSIKPEWCLPILDLRKTLELRTVIPQLSYPYKSYIYCSINGVTLYRSNDDGKIRIYHKKAHDAFLHHTVFNGKVIAEWICDGALGHCEMANADLAEQRGLMKREKIYEYSGFGEKEVKGLHISDLKIYDKPKELAEFYRWSDGLTDIRPCQNGKLCEHLIYDYTEGCEACAIDFDGTDCPYLKVQRPPQSWMYVEEL